MKYVQHARGKWKVRVTVPEELRDIIGARELVESGLPSDAKSRERLALRIINRFLAQIDEAREVFEMQKCGPKPTLAAAAKAHYAERLAEDDQKRAAMPTLAELTAEHERVLEKLTSGEVCVSRGPSAVFNATTDYELMLGARDFYANNRTRRLAALRASARSGERRWIEPAVEQYISDAGLSIRHGTQEWNDLADALILLSAGKRDGGDSCS